MESRAMNDGLRQRTRASVCAPRLSGDEALIVLAKKGDRAAYAELYSRYARMVFLLIFRMTRNREDAEDVLQEASMKALIHLSTFDGRSSFSTWLTRIAINTVLMMRRKRRGHLDASISRIEGEDHIEEIQVPDRAPSAEDLLYVNERDHHLHRAIQRLPSKLRMPIELQLAEGLPVKDVATRLGISVSATKSRLLRARSRVGSAISVSNRTKRANPSMSK